MATQVTTSKNGTEDELRETDDELEAIRNRELDLNGGGVNLCVRIAVGK